jgi:hypothetical protein
VAYSEAIRGRLWVVSTDEEIGQKPTNALYRKLFIEFELSLSPEASMLSFQAIRRISTSSKLDAQSSKQSWTGETFGSKYIVASTTCTMMIYPYRQKYVV